MALIPLTRGYYTLVDDADEAFVRQWKWLAQVVKKKTGWAYVRARRKRNIFLDRELLQVPVGLEIDHINGDPLDNRRANLRIVNRNQQAQNRSARNKYGFKGVGFNKARGKYRAACHIAGKWHYGGCDFDTPEAAARGYDALVLRVCGPYARLNFPNEAPK